MAESEPANKTVLRVEEIDYEKLKQEIAELFMQEIKKGMKGSVYSNIFSKLKLDEIKIFVKELTVKDLNIYERIKNKSSALEAGEIKGWLKSYEGEERTDKEKVLKEVRAWIANKFIEDRQRAYPDVDWSDFDESGMKFAGNRNK